MIGLQGTGREGKAMISYGIFRSELWVVLERDAQGNARSERPADFKRIFMISLCN